MEPCKYGYRILGPTWAPRRLVDADAAFSAYAACDERAQPHVEAYLSAFDYDGAFPRHLVETGSTRDYAGNCGARFLWFDIDEPGDLEKAQRALVTLYEAAKDRYGLDEDEVLLFFSGEKGFHFGVPTTLWSPKPSPLFHRVARQFAERLAEVAGVAIDTGVYDKVRAFRAPNSRHARSGLHKVHLTVDEARHLTVRKIQRLAEEPRPFRPLAPQRQIAQAVEDWKASMHTIEQGQAAKAVRSDGVAEGRALNRLTLETIRDGSTLTVGERHRRLFSAAANLAEFQCPPDLAHALLTEAGLDSGLRPKDVKRQIDCGLVQHGGKISG